MTNKNILTASLLVALAAQPAVAEQAATTEQTSAATAPEQSAMPAPAEPEWEINWTPYIWAANLDADVTQGDVSGSGELDFSDIVDSLELAYMHVLEVNKGRWGLFNDIIYFDLADDKKGPIAGIIKADIDMTQTIIDLAGTYQISDDGNTTLFAGLRYIELDVKIKTTSDIPVLNRTKSDNESWTNLLLGVRQVYPINEKWAVWGKGDIATDFSDEMSYILTAGVNYHMTDLLDLKVGYRYAGVDYENGSFEFDETAQGAFTGLTFKW